MINFASIPATVSALVTALQAATWTPSGGSAQPAFDEVKFFEVLDMEEALSRLLISKKRICIVGFNGESWETQNADSRHRFTPVCRLTRNMLLIISDREIGNRTAAMYGSASTPGCYGLKDIAIDATCGPLIATDPAVQSYPLRGSPFLMGDARGKTPARCVFEQEIACVTWWRELSVADQQQPQAPQP